MQLKLTFLNTHEFVYPFGIFLSYRASLVKKEMRCLRNEICVRLNVDYRVLRGLRPLLQLGYFLWKFVNGVSMCVCLFVGLPVCVCVCLFVSDGACGALVQL